MAPKNADINIEHELSLIVSDMATDYAAGLVDAQGRIVHATASLLSLYGYTDKNGSSRPMTSLFTVHDAKEIENALAQAQKKGRCEWENWHVRKDGVAFWARTTLLKRGGSGKKQEEPPFVLVIRDLSERRKAEETIHQRVHYDELTGLPNTTFFNLRLKENFGRAREHQQLLALFYLDLDRFNKVNDAVGRTLGDLLLQQVVKRIQKCLRPQDMLARLGGDEFLIMGEVSHPSEASGLAQTIVAAFHPTFAFEGHDFQLTTSVGISLFPNDGEDPEILVRHAHAALNRAKEEGKNNFQFYTSAMSSKTLQRLTLENSLRRALQNKEFVLFYQPQLDLQSGKIVGMEALVRWQLPQYGLVPPNEFIPIAEETGLIVPLGEWILRTACTQNMNWQRAGLRKLRMAVNLSVRQFQQKDITSTIQRVLSETGLEPDCLDLEITETYAMENAEFAIGVLRDLKRMGVHLSIDDFGTGYSSLSYLKQFPIDTLKIDRSFIRDLSTDPNDAAIAEAIIALAHSLGLQVVGEGVETPDQLAILRKQKCDRIQGYLFSRPVPAEGFEKMIRENKALEY